MSANCVFCGLPMRNFESRQWKARPDKLGGQPVVRNYIPTHAHRLCAEEKREHWAKVGRGERFDQFLTHVVVKDE